LLFWSAASAADEHLTRDPDRLYLYTENYGDYNYSLNNREFEHWREDIGGSSTEMVKAIMADAGFDYRMRLRAWRVSYGRSLERPNHGVFSTARTEQREDLFHWIGPIAQYNWIVFRYAGSDVQVNSIDDLRNLRVGGYDNSATTLFLEAQGIEVSKLPNDNLNPQRLARDQIDVWIASDVNAQALADEAGFPDIEPALTVRTVDMYLAMNPQTPAPILQRLEQSYQNVVSQNGLGF
jgi:polar amino acid transport system substrate-binding protein